MLVIFLVLLGFCFIGAAFKHAFPQVQQELRNYILYELEDKSMLGIIGFIIWHNIQANLFVILSAVFVVLPLFALVSNGFIIGAITAQAVDKNGIVEVLKLLPHGVFEVPALLLSFSLSYILIKKIYWQKKNLFEAYKDALLVFLFVIIPLLIVAGIIEGALVYTFGSKLG